MTKFCKYCNQNKPVDRFEKRYNKCKDCQNKSRLLRTPAPEGHKICNICLIDKDIGCFSVSRNKQLGRMNACKECSNKKRNSFNYNKPVDGNRTCPKCNRNKHVSEFHKGRTNKTGLSIYCKMCDLLRKYKLSIEQYELLQQEQQYKCAICGSQGKLFIDHNHSTNNIRGLLCMGCNTAIGSFKDNINILYSAIEYIKRNSK